MNDGIKACKPIKNSLEVTHEVTKLIKYSPCREAIFQWLKDTHDLAVGHHTPGIRVLYPTRWTVCANALASILSNYEVLLDTWDEAVDVVYRYRKQSKNKWGGSTNENMILCLELL